MAGSWREAARSGDGSVDLFVVGSEGGDEADRTDPLRHGGRLHHIGLGYEHNGTSVRILIHDLHITVVNTDTGEIIRGLTLDPTRDYQPLGRPPGPPKGSPQRGGRKKKTPPST